MSAEMDIASILAAPLDAATKGYPPLAPPRPPSAVGAQGWRLLAGDLPFPQAVIRDSALAHNQAWMRDFTAATGVLLAPHGKTTMAPQIFALQLAAGAWGITVATVHQLAVCVRFGVRRVLMANQLLGAAEVTAVVRLREAHPDLEFHFLVDSRAQLAAIDAVASSLHPARKARARWWSLADGRTSYPHHDDSPSPGVWREASASACPASSATRACSSPATRRTTRRWSAN
jgi:D-serine dehydratase